LQNICNLCIIATIAEMEGIYFCGCNRHLKNKMLQPLNKSVYLVLKV